VGRIVELGKTAWCETPVRAAGVLIDGDDYFRAFYDAASKAKHSILLSGWQFDSDVELLRGPGAVDAPLPVTLKAFLNALCEQNPSLNIYILAWDFHMVFALEREWMQSLIFDFTTNERIHFHFDSSHVPKGCHHQKFVVIDGEISFLGGLDICDHRWDRSSHEDDDPLRMSRGEPHKPFHDIQTYLIGREVSSALSELFAARWKIAGGSPFELGESRGPAGVIEFESPAGAHLLPNASCVSLSRTDPKSSPCADPEHAEPCHEIVDLYVSAIDRAESSIYIETQYFSSEKLAEALIDRLRSAGRSALDVVLVLNMRAETLKEEVAVGLAQAKVLRDVRAAALGTAHQLGIYYSVPKTQDGHEPERATYIHSKLMIVDDRFLNIGSANLTNRSTSVDTELNASFEFDAAEDSIRALRIRLLSEHDGADLVDTGVPHLEARAAAKAGRLRLHPSPTERESQALDVIDPQALPFDPHSVDEEEDRSLFARGVGRLWRRLFSDRDDTK